MHSYSDLSIINEMAPAPARACLPSGFTAFNFMNKPEASGAVIHLCLIIVYKEILPVKYTIKSGF